MNFGQAIEALKNGNKVARSGWNGKGMWLQLYRPSEDEGIVTSVEGEGKWLPLAPHILMKQTDVLAEDWEEVGA